MFKITSRILLASSLLALTVSSISLANKSNWIFWSSFEEGEKQEKPVAVIAPEVIPLDPEEIQTDFTITDAINPSNGRIDGNITIDGDAPKDWKKDSVVLIPTKNNESGKLIKITEITKANGKTEVAYKTPTLDEAFEKLSINIDTDITNDMLAKARIRTATGVRAVLPQARSSKSPWFPGLSDNTQQFIDDYVKSYKSDDSFIKFAIEDMPIYKKDEGGNTQELFLNGHIPLAGNTVVFKHNFNRKDLVKSARTFKSQLEFHSLIDKRLALDGKMHYHAKLSESAIGKALPCGSQQKLDFDSRWAKGDVYLDGAYWVEDDICLATVNITVGNVSVKSGEKSLPNAPVELQVSLIMGADLEV